MPDTQPNGRVDYLHAELRDLRVYITQRFDALDARLDSKADAEGVAKLADRVTAIERMHDRWSLPRVALGAFGLAVLSALAGLLVARAFPG